MGNAARRLSAMGLTIGVCIVVSSPLAAQDLSVAPAIRAAMAADAASRTTALSEPAPARRSPLLMPLYVSFAALQVLDIHSTQLALESGGVEVNPMMTGVVGSPVAMTAVKVGATAGVILLTEKLRKRNLVAAVVMMVALNSAYAMVVSHNYAVARR